MPQIRAAMDEAMALSRTALMKELREFLGARVDFVGGGGP